MSKKGSRASGRAILASAILLAATSANAAAPLTLTGWDASAVDRARTGALKRLESDECRKVFTDFTDAQGRVAPAEPRGVEPLPAEYIGLIPFLDGTSQALCRKTKTALVASPGVRRVFVCKTFAEVQLRQPGVTESMVIHEILHTLGLGEAPQARRPDQHRDHAARRGAVPVGRMAGVQASEFDEAEFFRAIAASGTRALLIGRRALVALGIPVLTADYDFWIHIDDITAFNAAIKPRGSSLPGRQTRRALGAATSSRTTNGSTCWSLAPCLRSMVCGSPSTTSGPVAVPSRSRPEWPSPCPRSTTSS